MLNRAQIISKAREYVGTPVIHQGRVKGVGIDCVGLIVCVAKELGICIIEPPPEYRRVIRQRQVLDRLDEQFVGPKKTWDPGDILVMGNNPRKNLAHHLGIATESGIIHANILVRRVVEHILGEPYLSKVMCAYS